MAPAAEIGDNDDVKTIQSVQGRVAVRAAAMLAVFGLALALAPARGAAADRTPIAVPAARRYDIAAQPLTDALAQFATLSGVDILYDHSLAANRRSPPLVGVYTPQQAIPILLQGTGLAVHFTGRKAAVIAPADRPAEGAAAAKQSDKALDLDVMRVTASPLIGTPNAAFDAYGRAAQSELSQRLASDPSLNGAVFRIELWVRLDEDGSIRQPHLIIGSGDHRIDRKILALLGGARLSQAPPAGLPQPLRFRIDSR